MQELLSLLLTAGGTAATTLDCKFSTHVVNTVGSSPTLPTEGSSLMDKARIKCLVIFDANSNLYGLADPVIEVQILSSLLSA